MTREETAHLLDVLAALCPRGAPKDGKVALFAWSRALAPYDGQAVLDAALAYARENRWFPSLADLVKALPRQASGQAYSRPDPAELERMKKLRERMRGSD